MEINYSYSFKISKDFNSKSVSIGITDTVRDGEDANKAFERIKSFVMSKVNAEMGQAPTKVPVQPAPAAPIAPPQAQKPQWAPKAQAPQQNASQGVSEAQIKRMLAMSSKKGFDLATLSEIVRTCANGKIVNFKTKQNSLSKAEYEAICAELA